MCRALSTWGCITWHNNYETLNMIDKHANRFVNSHSNVNICPPKRKSFTGLYIVTGLYKSIKVKTSYGGLFAVFSCHHFALTSILFDQKEY